MRRESVAAVVLSLLTPAVLAGPLAPPAGPVDETYKTLHQVEPRTPVNADTTPGNASALFVIDRPGSYYLEGDIQGVPARHAILIESSDVTLDLRGFSIRGVTGSLDGISAQGRSGGDVFSVVVLGDGRVFNFRNGINGAAAQRSRVENVTVTNNDAIGILLADNATIAGCTVNANVTGGVKTGENARVEHCTVTNTPKGIGIAVGDNTLVSHCLASDCLTDGFNAGDTARFAHCLSHGNARDGFAAADGASFDECTAENNNANGFNTGKDSAFRACSANANSADGYVTDDTVVVESCMARTNGSRGFHLGTFAVVVNSTASGNLDDGFRTDGWSTFQQCSAIDNSANGFQIGENSQITRCLASSNSLPGIFGFAKNLIEHNSCINHFLVPDQASIAVNGRGNRIDSNHVSTGNVGVSVSGTQNLVVRNSVHNTPVAYDIPAGNLPAPIRTSFITTVGPWDNFEH